jgi:hypothetical protein
MRIRTSPSHFIMPLAALRKVSRASACKQAASYAAYLLTKPRAGGSRGLKMSTVRQYLWRVAKQFDRAGHLGVTLAKNNNPLKRLFQLARTMPLAHVRRAAPIDAAFVADATAYAGTRGARSRSHLRALQMAFAFAARASELCGDGNPAGCGPLQIGDWAFAQNAGGRWTQGDDNSATALLWRFQGSKTDKAAQACIRARGSSDAACFCVLECAASCIAHAHAVQRCTPSRSHTQPHNAPMFPDVKRRSLSAFLKKVASATGRDPSAYSSHSLRRGAAVAFFAATGSELALGWFGRWAPGSKMPRMYCAPSLEFISRVPLVQAFSLGH